MPYVRIYHNPRCSKSRATLELLRQHHIEPEIIDYLAKPPTTAELQQLLNQLNLKAHELVRRKESIFTELNLDTADDKTLIQAMSAHPKLIERPIVTNGQKAILGRPPENILELIHE